ncbi:MAG: heme-binding protein [Burkholderiales bacterium]|nr:heme-binding protein [Burkholderiales bacterium]
MQTGTMRKALGATALGMALATAHTGAMAIEEPTYQVVRRLDGVEVRQYAPYVVAQVRVDGSADEAGRQAFPILAGYIFGKNKGERKLEMTAPVTQAPVPVKMAMTAPVTQTAANGGYIVQFVLPREVTLATAPAPLDPRVELREVPGARVAVIRYSGFWSQSNYEEHLEKLEAALRAAGLAWSGEPVLARYNPPFTPWFLRRNEVWLQLDPGAPGRTGP